MASGTKSFLSIFTPADIAVVALAAATVGGLFAAYWQPPRPATQAEVRSGSEVVGIYDLWKPRALDVAGAKGASRLRIEDGRIRFVSSPCRNKVCIHSGWLSHRGDAAACLPNRVSFALLGGPDGLHDALAY